MVDATSVFCNIMGIAEHMVGLAIYVINMGIIAKELLGIVLRQVMDTAAKTLFFLP